MSSGQKSHFIAWVSGIIITGAWLAMMFSLARAYMVRKPEPVWSDNPFGTVQNAARWRDTNEYMKLISNGKAVGAARASVRRTTNSEAYRSEFVLVARLNNSILPTTISLSAAADLDETFHLTRFYAVGDLAVTRLTLAGEVLDGKQLLLALGKPGGVQRYKVPLQHPLAMADYMSPGLATQMPVRSGSHATIPIFDPFGSAAQGVVDIRIKGREHVKLEDGEREAYRVETSFHDIKTVMWVDALGQPIKRELAGGFALEKTTSESAISIAPKIEESPAIPPLETAAFADIPDSKLNGAGPGGIAGPFSLGW